MTDVRAVGSKKNSKRGRVNDVSVRGGWYDEALKQAAIVVAFKENNKNKEIKTLKSMCLFGGAMNMNYSFIFIFIYLFIFNLRARGRNFDELNWVSSIGLTHIRQLG